MLRAEDGSQNPEVRSQNEETEDRTPPGRWSAQFDRNRNLLALQKDHPVVTPAEAGVQNTSEKLDSHLRGNDRKSVLASRKAASFIQAAGIQEPESRRKRRKSKSRFSVFCVLSSVLFCPYSGSWLLNREVLGPL